MIKTLLLLQRYVVLLAFLLLLSPFVTAQQFVGGVRRGVIKVKFAKEMTTVLSRLPANARGNKQITGVQSVDEAVQATSATNLTRLFPFDPRYETKLRKHGLHLWYVMEIDEGSDPRKAVATFNRLSEVEVAEVEHEHVLAPYNAQPFGGGAAPMLTLPFNDPMLADQWHYENSGNTGYPGGADVNLFAAWQSTAGKPEVIVSIHDQGVDVKHQDLAANIWVNAAEANGVTGFDDDANGYVDDINGWNFDRRRGAIDPEFHGTHVAGTIAAVNNNGIGVSGVAGGSGKNDGVRVMSMQVLGGGNMENSYVYAANNGAVISQNSWGYTSPDSYEQSVLEAIDYFIAEAGDYAGSPMRGGIVIFAAGNSNSSDNWYPGIYESTLSVSSIGADWKKAFYSNYGDWVEIAAPGGNTQLGSKNGVLSTIPKNKYAYLEGTSMACPHVSGIAALALSNRTRQLTNRELWNKLVTGVVNIDESNPDYIGKLGTGAIDAALAIKNDQGFAPVKIEDLKVTGVAQEFMDVEWKVPVDKDDGQPVAFQLYYHTETITQANLTRATRLNIRNTKSAGDLFTYEIDGLLGLTPYYIIITSTDRWGNVSMWSSSVSAKTNDGPTIAVNEGNEEISIDVDVAASATGTHELTILNNGSGVLRWEHAMHHRNTSVSPEAAGIRYPKSGTKKRDFVVARRPAHSHTVSAKAAPMSFDPVVKSYTDYATNLVGEQDFSLTNSAAAKFYVTEADGFNLTDVSMDLQHKPDLGPVIVEVYQGETLSKAGLIYAQEHNNYDDSEAYANVTLKEQLYFESGTTFWVVFHVPAGNEYPLGIGLETQPNYSENCFVSFDMGGSWMALNDALEANEFAWAVSAMSYNKHLGTYLTLEPGQGDVPGNGSVQAILSADAAQLINGSYQANMVIASNDAKQRELRVPITLNVTGHQPAIQHTDIVDFGAVFVGLEKTIPLTLKNTGYGNFNNPEFSISGSQFALEGSPWQIQAREEVVVNVTFKPTSSGSANDALTITNGFQTYTIPLVGVGAEASKISISPEEQSFDNVTIGDKIDAQITVENVGAYPLKYFIPGFDEKGISANWPTKYHSYGYKRRSNAAAEVNPLAYEFLDIKGTGVRITQNIPHNGYYALDMGFEFPFYDQQFGTIYIAKGGFTTFDNSVQAINDPSIPGNEWTPKGYISPLGTFLTYVSQGEIYYRTDADRVIIQFDNVTDGSSGNNTVQMVLFTNGDIRFYYEELSVPVQYLNVLIEDIEHQDGILLNNYEQTIDMYGGLTLGLDFPGPDIIAEVENGSGILLPGQSALVGLSLNTDGLSEGDVKRYVTFISNDPALGQTSALVKLAVTEGGVPLAALSAEAIAFGDVFQGATKSQILTIKNKGTADLSIASMTFASGQFSFIGDHPTVIKPSLYKRYEVIIPTTNLASLNDRLVISYTDGDTQEVEVTGNVVLAPDISVDLSPLEVTVNYGETTTRPFEIQNTGESEMEVAVAGTPWVTFEVPTKPSGISVVPDFTYVYEKNNDGSNYQWIDIRRDGTQLPFLSEDFEGSFWRSLDLPFPLSFYGKEYTSVKVGDNGILSFEEEPQAMLFTEQIPSETHAGPCIMPYWTFSGFSWLNFDQKNVGIFYKYFDDKIIITWSYFVNNFGGMGDPVSAQVIFYKNGTMKFQYKAEEGGQDLTSQNSIIGLQRDSDTGITISAYVPLDYGSGLAYTLTPAERHVVMPGSSLAGELKFDGRNVYGGIYDANMSIRTNVPNQESLSRPVRLTVVGEAVPLMPETVDFGEEMLVFDDEVPAAHFFEFDIANTGSAAYDITWIKMADGGQGLALKLAIEGNFGTDWIDIRDIYFSEATETPTYRIRPGEKMKLKAVFMPESSGAFSDDVLFTTTVGELHLPMRGIAIDPPVIAAATDSINVKMHTISTETRVITFDNVEGKSDLKYQVAIEYERLATTLSSKETIPSSAAKAGLLKYVTAAGAGAAIQPLLEYNRVISHTDDQAPDTFVGTGGTAPFTVATQFNAGERNFNISHIITWFRREELTTGSVDVEVRVGGSSIVDAVLLATGTVTFSGDAFDETGSWLTVPLDKEGLIYPNETFYVIVTYPLGIEHPQGTLTDMGATADRYYYDEEGVWDDIQELDDFTTAGWLMYAAEQTAMDGSWIGISSAVEGTMTMGSSSGIELKFDGQLATRGTQQAKIVITSNDPKNPKVRIPVSLHLNEAPKFTEVPEGIVVAEGASTAYQIVVKDPESDHFEVASAEAYEGVTFTLKDNILSLVFSPDYGAAGNYEYTFVATDAYDAHRDVTLYASITHTNRAPVLSGEEPIDLTASSSFEQFDVSQFFNDPDGDAFTFTVNSLDAETAEVFASVDKFLVRPSLIGETKLAFVLTDSHGAVSKDTVGVRVNAILSTETGAANGVAIYPNPVSGSLLKLKFGGDWSGTLKTVIRDATGRVLLSEQVDVAPTVDLNIGNMPAGFYLLDVEQDGKRITLKLIRK